MIRPKKYLEAKPGLAPVTKSAIFGRANRPSTPVKEIISGSFAVPSTAGSSRAEGVISDEEGAYKVSTKTCPGSP